jgi:hypothetical protein
LTEGYPERDSRPDSPRSLMPWYWSDDIAKTLAANGRIDAATAASLTAMPVAIRRQESTLDEAASAMQEDGEIPLAA